MKQIFKYAVLPAALVLSSCSYDTLDNPVPDPDSLGKINLSGEINQQYETRANDNGFADGDVMGVYIVDYNDVTPGTLLSKGNRGDNVRHTFNANEYSWKSAYDLYWKDKHTPIDVYGYYPYSSPEDVNNFSFTVKTDQSKEASNGTMGGYEASDFLWGKVEGVAPTSSVINLPLTHRMANARVTLIEGSGFAQGEWADLTKQVLVCNTVHDCSIDLATGNITPTGTVSPNSIIPSQRGDEWRAIVVPQTVSADATLFSITIDGTPYKFLKNEDFTYVAGKMNNFGIRVDKKENTGKYTLTLTSESITAWENDLVSHDATMKEYIVIDVQEPGTLEQCIAAAGKDLTQLKNLKVTGKINQRDFVVMKDKMSKLSSLNMKEVKIVGYGSYKEDEIPEQAIQSKTTLINLILPDKLKYINSSAFSGCSNLSGSLEIPEGVVGIGKSAFNSCKNLTGTLSLPSTLKYIGDYAFYNCPFYCELILPDQLEEIGAYAFLYCSYFYGNLHLPERLKTIGAGAFNGKFSGSLEIPQSITNIPENCFSGCGFNGNLILHDGIEKIGKQAFSNNQFTGELNLPKNLEILEDYSFQANNFSGTLILPSELKILGTGCFAVNRRLTGIVEIPENIRSIGSNAFANCNDLEGVIFPEGLETIMIDAFLNCFQLNKIVCKGLMPAKIVIRAFDGVPKDNFTVEVPEAAIAQYQTASGWREFKRIAAHHELVCRPSVACALSTKHTQTLVIDAESDWDIASKPDWCTVTPSSGSKKTEVTLTINTFEANSGSREGDVVFHLKDKDYTHSCHVTQYGYEYGEDQYIPLQKATRGNNGGINIVIVGDGYDAKEIANGTYLKDMREEIEHFFGIEPYTTYRDYFNVYTAIAMSAESGVGSVNTIRYNRFGTTYTRGVKLKCDEDALVEYILNTPTVNNSNLNQTLAIVIPNSQDYGGVTNMWSSGFAIAFCPKSNDEYPYDSRGLIQHEAGGHGFGKLGDEYIYHNAFIDACICTDGCKHVSEFNTAKSLGWYDNLELTGKMHQVGWSHLIFDPRYSEVVDIFEGGFMHARGVFRSEHNSCMNNNIPYYSTISRESIVKRIKRYAGETYSFEDFVANDKKGASQAKINATRGTTLYNVSTRGYGQAPVIRQGNPLDALKSRGKKGNAKRTSKR